MAAQEVVLLGQEIHLVELIPPAELVLTDVAFVFSGAVVPLPEV